MHDKFLIAVLTALSLTATSLVVTAAKPSAPELKSKQTKESPGSTISLTPGAALTPEQVAAESKRANEFLDKVFDEFVANHPQTESQLGIKTHYDQWNDISDEAAKRDLETEQKNLAELKRQFPKEKLDAQTQLSLELFEFNTARDIESFQYRLDSYPVNQMGGLHSETPTFLINIHKIDSEKDAQAYIARLNGL